MVVLVTGASGQLGQALQSIASRYPQVNFYWAGSSEGDITDMPKLLALFEKIKPAYCINAAAYTAVDKAESEADKAALINVQGAANLAEVCKAYGTTLIHISTDFVFDGSKESPYSEDDETNPQGVYGATKRDGEKEVQKALQEHYIIRTSWVYSKFGNNFMKTMLRLASERNSLNVVNDQIGTPTNAVDLAEAIMSIILSGKKEYGIYNFSNEGVASWYDFAKEIFRINNVAIDLTPISTSAYPTPAKRPAYSVLNKTKIRRVFALEINNWESVINK